MERGEGKASTRGLHRGLWLVLYVCVYVCMWHVYVYCVYVVCVCICVLCMCVCARSSPLGWALGEIFAGCKVIVLKAQPSLQVNVATGSLAGQQAGERIWWIWGVR